MPFGCRYQFAVIIQRDHNLNAPPWASSMSDSEQITPPQLGCCQQEASWPVSCTYLPLHLLSRVHALELPLHFPEPEDKVMLLFVVFFAFWIIPMILTLSTSCSSRLKVTQQRELTKYYRLLQKQFTRKTRSNHRKTQAEYQSPKISNVHTANARPHFNVYQRMLQGENKIQIPSSPDHQHTFPFSSAHISHSIHTFPIHFSHIPSPRNSVAKSTRHLFISKRVSPDPRPAKCFYVQEIVIPEQIHVTQTKPGGIVRRTAASSPSTGHFPNQVTSARRCP